MLDRGRDAGPLHAVHEVRDLRGHHVGIGTVATLQRTDRPVPVLHAGGHHIGYRSEVGVDARRTELATPALSLGRQLLRRDPGLAPRRRDPVESRAAQALYLPAFLINGQHDRHPARLTAHSVDSSAQPADGRVPGGAVAEQDHRIGVGAGQHRGLPGGKATGADTDHQELPICSLPLNDVASSAHVLPQVGTAGFGTADTCLCFGVCGGDGVAWECGSGVAPPGVDPADRRGDPGTEQAVDTSRAAAASRPRAAGSSGTDRRQVRRGTSPSIFVRARPPIPRTAVEFRP